MFEFLGGLGIIGFIMLAILGILLPVSAYSAQNYAYKCFKELKKINDKLDTILDNKT